MTASLIAAAAVATAAFVEHILRHPDGGWDAWMIWNLRARFLARAGEGFRAAFSPEMLFWVHQDYPLLLPGVVAQGFLAAGSQPLWLPAAAAYGFAAVCVCLLGAGVAAARGSNSGLLAALVLLATPCFVGFAANEQSDVPLACFVLAACAIGAWAIETGGSRDLLLAGLAASLGAWTKNEGAVHLASLLVALLLVRWAPFPKRLRGAVWFTGGALPVLVLLAWFKLRVASPNDLLQGNPGSLLDAHRWVSLGIELARRLVFFQNWGLWLAAELAVVVALVRWRSPPASACLVGVAAIVSLVATAIVYVLQPHELVWFVRASADRVLIQLWPAIVFATFLSLTPAAAQEAR